MTHDEMNEFLETCVCENVTVEEVRARLADMFGAEPPEVAEAIGRLLGGVHGLLDRARTPEAREHLLTAADSLQQAQAAEESQNGH